MKRTTLEQTRQRLKAQWLVQDQLYRDMRSYDPQEYPEEAEIAYQAHKKAKKILYRWTEAQRKAKKEVAA